MITFLETIKNQGKAVLITGPEGTGKTLLAKALVGDVQVTHVSIAELLRRYNPWMIQRPHVVIVEGFVNTSAQLELLKQLIQCDKIRCETMGRNAQLLDNPVYIFETHEPVSMRFYDCRRFHAIEMRG